MFENVNGAVAEQSQTTGEMSDNAASASNFIVSVGKSTTEIDIATQQAEAHGESVAKAGRAVTTFAQKLKSRCAVLLRQGESQERRKQQKLPCSLKVEIETPRGLITAPVYEISIEGILISGPDAEKLTQNQSFADVNMGFGVLVNGLASLIVGEQLIGRQTLARQLTAPLVGAVVYYQVVSFALALGMQPSDLKLLTGLFVLALLGLPLLRSRRTPSDALA